MWAERGRAGSSCLEASQDPLPTPFPGVCILDVAGPGASHPDTHQSLVWLPSKGVTQASAPRAEVTSWGGVS